MKLHCISRASFEKTALTLDFFNRQEYNPKKNKLLQMHRGAAGNRRRNVYELGL
jgi:hypothetical protein